MSQGVVLERLSTASAAALSPADHLQRKRVYIFLTLYGLIFSINLIVMLLGSVNYNNSLAYALTFLLAGLFLVSMLHTYNNLRGLIISAAAAEPVFAGQPACFPLLLDNRTGVDRISVNFQRQTEAKKKSAKKKTDIDANSLDIPAGTLQALDFRIDTVTRGRLLPGRIKISSSWPIGLFRAWSYMPLEHSCIVYPSPYGTTALPQQIIPEGEEQNGQAAGSEDFIGFRQYQAGDSMRALDWKAYARECGLLTKRFSGKGAIKILLDWQQTAHLNDIEARLSQLCLWIIEAEKLGAKYTLIMPGFNSPEYDCGDRHRHLCLGALAEFDINGLTQI